MRKIFCLSIFISTYFGSFSQIAKVSELQITNYVPDAPVITGLICPGSVKVWDKAFGGSKHEVLSSMIHSNDGGFLLGGYSDSEISGDKTQASKGGLDYWVVKIDSNGNREWDKCLGGDEDDYLWSLVAVDDGGYLLGGQSNSGASGDKTQASRGSWDYWVVKLDADGNKEWDRTFGSNGVDEFMTLIVDNNGEYLLGGHTYAGISGDKTQSSRGSWDYWIVKIDVNGNKIWDRRFGGNNGDYLNSIITTENGGYLLVGDSDSEISGDKTQASRGGWDYWVVKIDVDGIKEWDKRFGGDLPENVYSIIATSDGKYLMGGVSGSSISGDKTEGSLGEADYWIVKMDADGNKEWDKRFGGNKTDQLRCMLATNDGGYLLGGGSFSGISGDRTESSYGDDDYWIIKLNSEGNREWDKRFGGHTSDELKSILLLNDGSYLLGGFSFSDISGDKTDSLNGIVDYWLVKMAPCQTITNFCEGQNITLVASGCKGTVNWSNGATGNQILVNIAGTYSANCTLNSGTSVSSNSIIIIPTSAVLNGVASNETSKAVETIISSETVPLGTNKVYQAGKSISLNGTFYAQTGSIFKAEIKGCNE